MSSDKTRVLKLDKPKKEWVETYQELNILAKICGHIDLWYEHYPFKKWVTHKYFPEVDMDNDDFPEGIFSEDDFCDQELIQEWIDETHQPFKLMSMPDQKGFYFYVSENNIVSTDKKLEDMTKTKAINFLYKDWLDYKKYYKEKQNFNMKETFIEYLKEKYLNI